VLPAATILAIRAALRAGQPVNEVAKRWHVSRRYVRNLGFDETWRRSDARILPPAVIALENVTEANGADPETGEQARDVLELANLLPWR
jgi:hypothetical protein